MCGTSNRRDQPLEIRQRRKINLWLANSYIGANDRVHHPAGNRDNNAGRPLDLEKLSCRPLFYLPHDDIPAEMGMPTIMNFPLLADMGRMNGRWP